MLSYVLLFYDNGETDIFTMSRKVFVKKAAHTSPDHSSLIDQPIDLSTLKHRWIHYTLKPCPYILIYVHVRGSVNIN